MKSKEKLSRDFKEFLGLLLEEKVEFALVGGYAVSYHGYPRYTGDLDILLKRDEANAAKAILVLRRFGFASVDVSEQDLAAPDNVVQLGFPPVRIDLITSLTGITNEEIFPALIQGEFYGMKIPIISKEHLIRNKKATGRTQDLLDVENLE